MDMDTDMDTDTDTDTDMDITATTHIRPTQLNHAPFLNVFSLTLHINVLASVLYTYDILSLPP